ncbi:MAG: hypothetical protein ACI9IL_000676 [Rickettsiales bacterium]|jgi:hypothetical protein
MVKEVISTLETLLKDEVKLFISLSNVLDNWHR